MLLLRNSNNHLAFYPSVCTVELASSLGGDCLCSVQTRGLTTVLGADPGEPKQCTREKDGGIRTAGRKQTVPFYQFSFRLQQVILFNL